MSSMQENVYICHTALALTIERKEVKRALVKLNVQ